MPGKRKSRSEVRQRTKLIALRLLPAEYDRLSAVADAQQVTVSQFIRAAALAEADGR